ncbi:MAG: aldo/keto reductase [Pseudomonadota bacterium]|nr:aldo/keto reductase [Pseudomonadota bacterium]
MKKRAFGRSSLSVSPLIFGGNVFGWTLDEKASFTLLDGVVDAGINMIDTANVYSAWVTGNQGGESETIIGNWLQKSGKRKEVLIATKVGMEMGDGTKGLSKANILRSAEASLKRLKTDYIDVYYAHADDEETPIEESLSAFEQLINEGKVGTVASSNYSAQRLSQALDSAKQHGLPQFIAHQPEYNLFDRKGYEDGLDEVCQQYGLGVVTYFSLASGFLTGKYRTAEDLAASQRGEDFIAKYMTDRGMKILDVL